MDRWIGNEGGWVDSSYIKVTMPGPFSIFIYGCEGGRGRGCERRFVREVDRGCRARFRFVSLDHGGGGGRIMFLEIPESFEVPSSYVSEVEAFEVLVEVLEEKRYCMLVLVFIGVGYVSLEMVG